MKKTLVCAAILAAAFAVGCRKKHHGSNPNFACANPTLSISELIPSSGWNQEETSISVLSTAGSFVSTPQIHLAATAAQNVAFLNANAINGIVPSGLDAGSYDVIVTNPDGSCGILLDGYTAAVNPPPRISTVFPGSVDKNFTGTILISGSNFESGATGALVDSTGTEIPLTLGTAGLPSQLTATTSWASVSTGAYLVKVTNPDAQFDRYSLLVVTGPSGKLDTLVDAMRPLVTPRAYAGAAEGRDDKGNRFVYAVGGSSGTAILSSVEAAQTDLFGNVGAWGETSPLNAARSGAGVVRVGEWIYAAAGTGTNGALASVERARILPRSESPQITAVSRSAAGNLAAGTWYYRVAAKKIDGETVASGETTITVDSTSKIHVAWNGVSGAIGYRVYRTPNVDGTSGTEVLLADLGPVATYDDDTAATTSTEKPRLQGSLSTWVVDAQSIPLARGHVQAAVVYIGTQPWIYVVGGAPSATTFSGEADFAPVNPDGSLGAFTASTSAFNPRVDFGISVTSSNSVPGFTGAPRVGVFAGRNVNGTGNGGGVGGEVEFGAVGTNGQLTVAVVMGTTVQGKPAGLGILEANGFIYGIGGGNFGGGVPSPGAAVSESTLDSTGAFSGSWSSSSVSLVTPRYGAGVVQQGAFLYVIGGVGNAGALSSVEQAIY